MPHGPRPKLSGREPVLVTLKVRKEIASLRVRRVLLHVTAAVAKAVVRFGVRIVEYSVQRDHVHLLVEAESKPALSRAMKGLSVRLARAIHRALARKGTVFADRYHARVLTTPRQTRNALAYVLCNGRKHGHAPSRRGWLDPCSTASAFDGWNVAIALTTRATAAPRTWLLRVGWRRGGLLDPDHHPGQLPS